MIGIDEVGRGAWAGPLLVVAVKSQSILPKNIKDSKKLSRNQREILALEIRRRCEIGEGWATPNEVDKLGMTGALRLCVARALKIIEAEPNDEIIIDGHVNYASSEFKKVQAQIRADEYVPIVSSASIIAKTMRDAYMRQLAKDYTNFGFDSNVGYGTRQHINALDKYGPIKDVHRFSFKPIIEILK